MNTKPIKVHLPKEARRRTVALLNCQLADALDLRLHAKQALWNMHGAKFGTLPEVCNQVAQTTHDASEVLAKRAVELGGVAEATIQGVTRNLRLGLHPFALTDASDYLWAFCGAFVRYAATAREAIRAADLAGDHDTGDLFILISRSADRLLWQVGANLGELWERAALSVAAYLRTPVELTEIPDGVGR